MIAAHQGVTAITSFDDLLGHGWPDDEPPDDLVATIRQWRREGGYA